MTIFFVFYVYRTATNVLQVDSATFESTEYGDITEYVLEPCDAGRSNDCITVRIKNNKLDKSQNFVFFWLRVETLSFNPVPDFQ